LFPIENEMFLKISVPLKATVRLSTEIINYIDLMSKLSTYKICLTPIYNQTMIKLGVNFSTILITNRF